MNKEQFPMKNNKHERDLVTAARSDRFMHDVMRVKKWSWMRGFDGRNLSMDTMMPEWGEAMIVKRRWKDLRRALRKDWEEGEIRDGRCSN